MRYYNLLDDVHVPGRWHLGEITNRLDGSTQELWVGSRVDYPVSLETQITHPGKALDYSLTSFANPIARKPLAQTLTAIADNDLQVLPVSIAGYKDFEILNIVRLVPCLDEKRSEFIKWTKDDHRPDLAGQYRMVTKLKVDVARIPSDAHIFRIQDWEIDIIVSEEAKISMERCGCLGARFQLAS